MAHNADKHTDRLKGKDQLMLAAHECLFRKLDPDITPRISPSSERRSCTQEAMLDRIANDFIYLADRIADYEKAEQLKQLAQNIKDLNQALWHFQSKTKQPSTIKEFITDRDYQKKLNNAGILLESVDRELYEQEAYAHSLNATTRKDLEQLLSIHGDIYTYGKARKSSAPIMIGDVQRYDIQKTLDAYADSFSAKREAILDIKQHVDERLLPALGARKNSH